MFEVSLGNILLKLYCDQSISTADNLRKPLQQRDLLGHSLLQNQKQVTVVFDAQLFQAILVFKKDFWIKNY